MNLRGRKSGPWTEELEAWLKTLRKTAPLTEPIPASRALAKRYGVVHTSVFRQLQRLEAEGLLWKAENGRFYFPEARPLVQKARPIACLFRKIENWSLLYQELMEGIAQGCENQGLGSLLWHEEALVHHSDPGAAPVFADARRQTQSLQRFVERYGDDVGGIILDHIWTDSSIARLPESLRKNAVLLCRPTSETLPAVYPDFRAASTLALARLSALGYEKIHPVRPFPHDASVEHCINCLVASVTSPGTSGRLGPVFSAETPAARTRLLRSLTLTSTRTALIFPEDNVALLFWQECLRAKLPCPEKIGILSLQGTRAAANGQLTHIRTNYHELGQRAVELCLKLPSSKQTPTFFVEGASTGPGDSKR